MRLDAAVPAHQGHVRQALRVVQAREHLHTTQLVNVPVVVKNVKKSLLQTFLSHTIKVRVVIGLCKFEKLLACLGFAPIKVNTFEEIYG